MVLECKFSRFYLQKLLFIFIKTFYCVSGFINLYPFRILVLYSWILVSLFSMQYYFIMIEIFRILLIKENIQQSWLHFWFIIHMKINPLSQKLLNYLYIEFPSQIHSTNQPTILIVLADGHCYTIIQYINTYLYEVLHAGKWIENSIFCQRKAL